MLKRTVIHALAVAALAIAASSSAAFAQDCYDKAGEATASSRDEALKLAYEAVPKATDQRLWQAWLAGGRRIGDAPGWTIRKMTSQCSAGGAGQNCRVMVTLCRL